jgi:hypothetical protein
MQIARQYVGIAAARQVSHYLLGKLGLPALEHGNLFFRGDRRFRRWLGEILGRPSLLLLSSWLPHVPGRQDACNRDT